MEKTNSPYFFIPQTKETNYRSTDKKLLRNKKSEIPKR